jgi:hypothetical protein
MMGSKGFISSPHLCDAGPALTTRTVGGIKTSLENSHLVNTISMVISRVAGVPFYT